MGIGSGCSGFEEYYSYQQIVLYLYSGVYSDENSEIVETERLALVFYHRGKHIMGAKLYDGNGDTKYLLSVCEKNFETKKLVWAYAETGKPDEILSRHSNDAKTEELLGELFNRKQLDKMKLQESFLVNHGEFETHTVSEKGIRQCLLEWRKGAKVTAFNDGIGVQICVGNKEYVYEVREKDENIYCGGSYNIPFELGLRSYGQYFRLRNYQDNSQTYCNSFFDFDYKQPDIDNIVNDINLGCVVKGNDDNYTWFIKRYSDTEIVLAGCGDDEYRYSMNGIKYERFV